MFLSGMLIGELVEKNEIVISPFARECIKPASYTLHLDSTFRRWKKQGAPIKLFDYIVENEHMDDIFEDKSLVLAPGEFVLGSTLESVSIPSEYAGIISPLSHVARFGLSIHCGADWVNPGFGVGEPTKLTLELVNNNSRELELSAGMPIAHLKICNVRGDTSMSMQRSSIYQGSCPLTAPKFYDEWSD